MSPWGITYQVVCEYPVWRVSTWCVLTSALYRKTHLLKLAPLLDNIAGAKDRAKRATPHVQRILDLKLELWKHPIDQREPLAQRKQSRKRTPTTSDNRKSKRQQVGKVVPLTASTNGPEPSLLSEVTMDTHRKYYGLNLKHLWRRLTTCLGCPGLINQHSIESQNNAQHSTGEHPSQIPFV
jgi:hypothetical protein